MPRIFCIGRNYLDHVNELNNKRPFSPVIFMKPLSCLVEQGSPIRFPSHAKVLHHEVEIVLVVGKSGRVSDASEALSYIDGVTIGLDLTLRDLQKALKDKGLPWEKAKAFDGSSPIGNLIKRTEDIDLGNIDFGCRVNDDLKQEGNSGEMLFSIPELLVEISKIWQLEAGDLIYTGTPAGVGPLEVGDRIEIFSSVTEKFGWDVTE